MKVSDRAAAGFLGAPKYGVYPAPMDTKANVGLAISHPASIASAVEQLSDAELLAGARRLVGRSNHLLGELIAHLAEVEARGIHRTRACSSLYTYCIYELRFSEDEAFRRVAAARLVRRFPPLLDALASGELHLTGLLLLGPHLTEQNLVEVLARAKHRTKREITRLVRILDPFPAVPARIEPLGPAPARLVPSAPTWEEFVQAACPVRELEPGERPRDWVETEHQPAMSTNAIALPRAEPVNGSRDAAVHRTERGLGMETGRGVAVPERYKVQFTANEEYVRLVDEAKALLSHSVPNARLDDIHLRAMRAFVALLKKQKYATKAPSKASATPAASGVPERYAFATPEESAMPEESATPPEPGSPTTQGATHPRQRGRHIPAAVRRVVATRDGERCSYVDGTGRRCSETHCLEFHHVTPFAHGGAHTPSNLTLRCRAHNALAAEDDFGGAFVEQRKEGSVHEPFRRQVHCALPVWPER